jgi:hypothetical protein
MIVINESNWDSQIATLNEEIQTLSGQIGELEQQLAILKDQKRQPIPWLENTICRVLLSDRALANLVTDPDGKALIDMIYDSPTIKAERCVEKVFVYLDWIYPDHRNLLLRSGGAIMINPICAVGTVVPDAPPIIPDEPEVITDEPAVPEEPVS